MSSSSPWDTYSQHGLPSSLEPYAHPFTSDMRSLATGSAAAGMGGLAGEAVLGYPKSSDLSAATNLNLASQYAAYGQSAYPGVPDLGFSSASLRSGSSAHSPGVAASDNLNASSPHGQFSGTPTSETQSASPSFSNASSLYTPSTLANSIPTSPYAQAFGGTSGSATDSSARAGPFSHFSQSYGYPMYGYNQMGGFPSAHANSLENMNRYMGGISSSQLMQPSAMGLYSNSQQGQMPFPYSSTMGWGPGAIPGFPLKQDSDLISSEELERYRYRQLSNPYFHGLPPGPPGRGPFSPHALQAGMMRGAPFMDDRVHSPTPKKSKKSTEEVERPPTPAPRDPACFHSQRGIYLFTSTAEASSSQYYADRYILSEKELCEKLSRVSLPGKIQYVYNPLEYAFDSHLNFVRRFCTGEKFILFVGMNPGPFGMSQNGVPFGECAIVKEWLQIEGEVFKPVLEHPKRRVVGLECSRSEVTGGRFWQLFRTLCHTPEHFFRTSYVHNLCPFAFLTDSGKNVTPPQLTSSVLDQINNLCNATLVEVVRLLKCKYVICIGKYALAQAQKALSADEFNGTTLECLMHPSPINPAANKGWADIAIKQLTEIGIIDIIRYGRLPYQHNNPSLSHQPHGSSSSSSAIPLSHHHHQHHHPYNKQSPGHYGFQSPPVPTYHHSPAQGPNNNHQSPVHTSAPNQSPAHASARNQSSPAHANRNTQSSPAHSSCSQSPAQQMTQQPLSQSPSQNATNSTPLVPDVKQEVNKDCINTDRNNSFDAGSLDSQDANCDKSHDVKGPNGHGFVGDSALNAQENGLPNSQSEAGSQGSEVSTANSPGISFSSGGNPQMTTNNPMNPSNPAMHLSMSSGSHSHLGGMGQISSPGLQATSQDQLGALTSQPIGSPQMNPQNPHLNSMASHLPPHMGGSQGSHSAMSMGMPSSMNPYGQPVDVNPMGSYAPGMSLNSYTSSSPGMRGPEMGMYGGAIGMQNASMGGGSGGSGGMSGMGSGMLSGSSGMTGSQMAMFNPHMSNRMMGGPEHHMSGMHPGINSMYGPLDASQMGNHYSDKPPDCS